MKLRKLELFGFKSFYDKTAFAFSDGITAIVGPNGCGKSNIVDAIRWVLGEHAPSYLRSKALEDVIFAGSDAAGPLGMAEVSLTFSNDDGFAPPGYESYAEIQVTRRAFRNGDSEFFINKVPCRLKDIAELFMDTGAGARGYAIIEQGRIMSIVNAKPEEKRQIIEEAAGVAKFRVRRREAERKMESTRQNLTRVKDVLDEVKRQLGSLERQVRKAERFKVLRDELRDLDFRIAARDFLVLNDRRARVDEELAGLENRVQEVRGELSRLEADREAERIRQAESEDAGRRLRDAHGAVKEEIARLSAEWDARGRESEQLRAMIAETAAEIVALEGDIADVTRRIAEGEEESRRREEELAVSRDRRAGLSAAAEDARAEYMQVQAGYDRARSDLMVRVTHHSNALSGAESLRKRIEESERSLARLEERRGEARGASEEAERRHREAVDGARAAREDLEAAETAWEETGNRLSDTVARLEGIVASRRDVEGRLKGSSSRLEALSQLYERRDWTSSGVRAVLQYYRDGGAPEGGADGRRILGIIGELIETAPDYERAVEAVLGERMQSIVVRDHEEGVSALHYLKESKEGRGAFMPVTLRSRGDRAAWAGEEGVVAPLIDVVQAPEECGDLVRGLMGSTLLVRDIGSAMNLWNRNGVWNSYVTLDGDVLTADGILIGGHGESGETGVLARKREMRELEKETAALKAEFDRLAAAEEACRRERTELEELREETFRRREACKAEAAAAEQRRAVLEMAHSQARARLDALVQEMDFLSGELARMREELSVLQEAARESETAKGEEEERVRSYASSVDAKRAAAEEARAVFHAAEIEWTGLEAKDRAAKAALAALRETLAGRQATLADRRRREESYAERKERLAQAVEEGRAAIDRANVELASRQEAIDRHLEEASTLQARMAGIEETLKAVRQRDAEVLARIADLRLEAQKVAMDLANLDDRIHQKYEVHPADLPPHVPGGDPAAEEEAYREQEARAADIRGKMTSIGDVNLGSLDEHKELSERYTFLLAQKEDLEASLDDLAKAIQRINRTTKERFLETFAKINEKLQEVFPKLFLGGKAYLTMLDEDNVLETGVEIVAQPPGKKLLALKMLSGGERTLTAASLIFSIFLVKPSPFCLLDEADAALDDANIDRFNALIRDMSASYQFLLITHSKRTMELADTLYGITMEKPGISKVVSVKFEM